MYIIHTIHIIDVHNYAHTVILYIYIDNTACFDWCDNILVSIITNFGTFISLSCLVSDYIGFQTFELPMNCYFNNFVFAV